MLSNTEENTANTIDLNQLLTNVYQYSQSSVDLGNKKVKRYANLFPTYVDIPSSEIESQIKPSLLLLSQQTLVRLTPNETTFYLDVIDYSSKEGKLKHHYRIPLFGEVRSLLKINDSALLCFTNAFIWRLDFDTDQAKAIQISGASQVSQAILLSKTQRLVTFSVSSKCLCLWDIQKESYYPIAEHKIGKEASAMCLASNGTLIITGHSDGDIIVWDIQNDQFKSEKSFKPLGCASIAALASLPDGRLAIGDSRNNMYLYERGIGSTTLNYGCHYIPPETMKKLMMLPDGKLASFFPKGNDLRLFTWDIHANRFEKPNFSMASASIGFNPQKTMLDICLLEDGCFVDHNHALTTKQIVIHRPQLSNPVSNLEMGDIKPFLTAMKKLPHFKALSLADMEIDYPMLEEISQLNNKGKKITMENIQVSLSKSEAERVSGKYERMVLDACQKSSGNSSYNKQKFFKTEPTEVYVITKQSHENKYVLFKK